VSDISGEASDVLSAETTVVPHLFQSPNAEGSVALTLLKELFLGFVAIPVEDLLEPQLYVGRERFVGLTQIREYLGRSFA
jgi:hypothetical protein